MLRSFHTLRCLYHVVSINCCGFIIIFILWCLLHYIMNGSVIVILNTWFASRSCLAYHVSRGTICWVQMYFMICYKFTYININIKVLKVILFHVEHWWYKPPVTISHNAKLTCINIFSKFKIIKNCSIILETHKKNNIDRINKVARLHYWTIELKR